MSTANDSYWNLVLHQFYRHKLGVLSLVVLLLYTFVGIYAPFFASSRPFCVEYDGVWFFPFFRYLFNNEFYTKGIDVFFNVLMLTLPLAVLAFFAPRCVKNPLLFFAVSLQLVLFLFFDLGLAQDPASSPKLNEKKQEALKRGTLSWQEELTYMTPYAKLNLLVRHVLQKKQHDRILSFVPEGALPPTLWQIERDHTVGRIEAYERSKNEVGLRYLLDRQKWLNVESQKLQHLWMPLVRPYHWEEDAGGGQSLNKYLPWWELTRINRKDLLAGLIFGVRISLVVGIVSVFLALLIGVPFGAMAGYYGGRFDMIMSRLLEVWESMPIFFMLLLVVAILQTKSIFLVIFVIGFFGWTGFSRFVRGEFFKQRSVPYVESCKAQGFNDGYIIFSHIMPNAIPPLLTLLPFAIMAAITSEAGLSFLGLGEEGSCSWGVLMDEGRHAFPGESYLLWPPAILLTVFLIAIALVGDAMRDAIDPKLH